MRLSNSRFAWMVVGFVMLRLAAFAAVPKVSYSVGGSERWVTVGQDIVLYVVASGTAPIQLEAVGLPPGGAFDPSIGRVSGQPTTAGDYVVTFRATNAEGSDSTMLTFHVAAADAPPVIFEPLTVDGQYENGTRDLQFLYYSISATGSPTSYAASPLSEGMYFSPSEGRLSCDKRYAGIFPITISATNAYGTATATLTVRIHGAALYHTSLTPEALHVGQTFKMSVQFNSGIRVQGPLGVYLSIGNMSREARYVSGSGTSLLQFEYTIQPEDTGTIRIVGIHADAQLTDVNGLSVGTSLPLRYNDIAGYVEQAAVITSAATASGTVGDSFRYATTTLGTPTQFYAEGLPSGLSLDATTGAITGTPTTSGTYPVSLSVSNGQTLTSITLTISIQPATTTPTGNSPAITSAPVATGKVGTSFAYRVEATGSPTSYEAAGLPDGLAIDATTGSIEGTPTSYGIYLVNLVVRNAAGAATGTLTISINRAGDGALSAQTVTFSVVDAVVIGQPVTLRASASSGLPVTFSLVNGNATLSGATLTVADANAVVVRATQSGDARYAPATADLTVLANRSSQRIDFASPVSAIVVGQPIQLGALASSGLPITYTVVSGPASIAGDMLTVTGPGIVIVRATQAGNAGVAPASAEISFTGELPPTGRLINLSARAGVSDGDSSRSFIAGFVISGSVPKRVLLRAIGPTLTRYGVQNVLPNPRLRLFDAKPQMVAENDDWSDSDVSSTATSVGAFALDGKSRDASLVVTLAPGNYSMQVLPNGGSGVALAEIYDADAGATSTSLINISTRGYVEGGEGVLAAGFVVGGSAPKRVLIRGIGPTLAAYGVAGVLGDPMVKIYQKDSVVAQNDDWEKGQGISTAADIAAAAIAVGAFPLSASSRDAALIVTLAPGAYSAVVSPASGGAGAGMLEVYELR